MIHGEVRAGDERLPLWLLGMMPAVAVSGRVIDALWMSAGVLVGWITIVNLLYLGAAVAGFVRGRFAPPLWLLLTFVILRSLFLGTLENPEPRYTLECYPVLIVLAAALLQKPRNASDSQS